ncbi:MAG TPA: hypothetical protein VGI39_45380 [Polyangiaceae bacterium]|jgi:hypothetical protein
MSISLRSGQFGFVCTAFALGSAVTLAACGGNTPAASDATSVSSSHSATTTSAGTGSSSLVPAGSAGSQKAERRTNAAWAPCHSSYAAATSADLSASADQLAKGCADTTRMHFIDSFKGTQAANNPPQSFKFHADANHCYRAYAVAASGITDLDLLIKDSAGAVAGEDSTDDPTPVTLEDGAVCFKEADDATVMVSIGGGAGAYAGQIWGD